MLEDLAAGSDVARLTGRLLREADAYGRLPTPVEDIIEAADLVEPEHSLLSDEAIAEAPAHLRKAMSRLKSKVLAVLDRKAREIHVRPDIQHDGQRRFRQLHEVTHNILPWQKELAYADDNKTLSWTTHLRFEQEANQGAAELLFQRERFAQIAAEYKTGIAAVVDLHRRFGASIHASFRRYVETSRKPLAGLVLGTRPCQSDPIGYQRQEALNSKAWAKVYEPISYWPTVIAGSPFSFIDQVEGMAIGMPRKCLLTFPNLDDEIGELHVELLSTSYRVLVLIWPPRRERFKRRRVLVPSHSEFGF